MADPGPSTPAAPSGAAPWRIVVAGDFAPDRFGSHIAETLEVMDRSVVRFEMSSRPQVAGPFRNRARLARELVDSLLRERVPALRLRRLARLAAASEGADLVLLTYDYLFPAEVGELKRRTGAKVAMWYPDHIGNMGRMAWLAAEYDGVFVKDPYIVHVLGEVAISPVYYLPEAFNPVRHRMPAEVVDRGAYVCDITTAGTLHPARVSVFRQLQEFHVRIWGDPAPWWLDAGPVARMYQGRPVVNEEKAVAFTSAAVVLNTLYPAEIWGINARAFEAAGVGAFQMLDWRPGLGQLFDDGTEVVSYRGVRDMVAKLRYYLDRPAERATIAEAAGRRAMKDHAYENRLVTLLRTLNGQENGHTMPPDL